jgi:hypothetical protein
MLMITVLKLHTIEIDINTFFELLFELFENEIAQLNVGFLQVEIVDDNIEVSWCQSVFELDSGGVETLHKTLFCLSVPLTQTLFQFFDGWRLDEHKDGVQVRISDLFDAFDLNVQNTHLSVLLNIFYGFFAKTKKRKFDCLPKMETRSISLPCTIHVATENCSLDEFSVFDSSLHVLNSYEMIVDSVFLSIARLSCRV